jgi:hypothetical protein
MSEEKLIRAPVENEHAGTPSDNQVKSWSAQHLYPNLNVESKKKNRAVSQSTPFQS